MFFLSCDNILLNFNPKCISFLLDIILIINRTIYILVIIIIEVLIHNILSVYIEILYHI